MATINSVTGPIDSADLGFTLMHEHVLVAASGLTQSYPDLLGPVSYTHLTLPTIRVVVWGVGGG